MLVLGIESSAHTLGVGIVKDGRILANERSMYPIKTQGILPSSVAEFHAKMVNKVIKSALAKAGVSIKEIEGIGYTKGPGIGTCLQIGMLAAKTIAYRLKLPIVPVNHAVAHIEIAKYFGKRKAPIALYVSGGNSQILKLDKSSMHYHVLGETLDVGVGNMLDSFARSAKLNPAWGSTVEKVAQGGRYIPLPYTVKGMDFTFTGLLTYAKKQIGKASLQDLCFSLQETAYAMLCEAAERALLLTNSKELCVCGGVAQSTRLKEMLEKMARLHKAKFGYAPNEFNADNGAMIAYVAEKALKNGYVESLQSCSINQRYRIETAEVFL